MDWDLDNDPDLFGTTVDGAARIWSNELPLGFGLISSGFPAGNGGILEPFWADFDQDGDPDLLSQTSTRRWENRQTEGFVPFDNLDVSEGITRYHDLDQDGDWDYLHVPNAPIQGQYLVQVRENESGSFSVRNPVFVSPGPIAELLLGDVNQDGRQDVLAFVEIAADSFELQVYRQLPSGNWEGGSSSRIVREPVALLYDWDQNGTQDLTLATSLNPSALTVSTWVSGGFADVQTLSLVSEGIASISQLVPLDADQDGDPDLMVLGQNGSGQALIRMIENQTQSENTPPSAPFGLSSSTLGSNGVQLSWNESTDDTHASEGLSYNLVIGRTSEGTELQSPLAALSSGQRYVPAAGNSPSQTQASFQNLAPGTYHWNVQAIDPLFAGGAFASAEQSFTIEDPVSGNLPDLTLSEVSLQPQRLGLDSWINLELLIQNLGGKVAEAHELQLYVSPDPQFSALDDVFLQSFSIEEIAEQGSRSFSVQFPLSVLSVLPPQWENNLAYVFIWIDGEDAVFEREESNNLFRKTIFLDPQVPFFFQTDLPLHVDMSQAEDLLSLNYGFQGENQVAYANLYLEGLSVSTVDSLEIPADAWLQRGDSAFLIWDLDRAFLRTDSMGFQLTASLFDDQGELLAVAPIKRTFRSYSTDPGLPYANLQRTSDLGFGDQLFNRRKAYNLISYPMQAAASGEQILEDDLGTYRPRKWRLFGLNPGSSSRTEIGLEEYESEFSELTPGESYLLITDHDGEIGMGAGEFPTHWEEEPAVLALRQGWNLIGTPYNFGLLWDSVMNANGDPELTAYEMKEGDWVVASNLSRQSGLLVWAEQATDLTIPFTKDPCLQSPNPCRRAQPLPAAPLDSSVWWADVELIQGEARYDAAGIGMHPDAQIGYDRQDRIAPPHWGGQVRMTLESQDHLAYEVVATQERYHWRFQLTIPDSKESTYLEWHPAYFGETGPGLVLFDPQRQQKVDMRRHSRYLISGPGTQWLDFYYGPEAWLEDIQPSQAALLEFAPNPTQGGGTIAYSLPPEVEGKVVELRVVSLQGQVLARLTEVPTHAGFHSVRWKGRTDGGQPLAQGMYLYQLIVEDQLIATRKFVRRD
ncbi:MAG: FG-GAP-like repeat-containing protein [Bacteroidota bacterium]